MLGAANRTDYSIHRRLIADYLESEVQLAAKERQVAPTCPPIDTQ